MTTPSSCPDLDRLRALLDNGLPPDEQAGVVAHLEQCEPCRRWFDALAAEGPWWSDVRRFLQPGARAEATQSLGAAKATPPSAEESPLDVLEPPSQPGSLGRFGPYEVLGVIGRGGMGVVFKALDPSLNRVVAVKVLAPQWATSAAARRRFLREARAAASICHEHVITIHAVDEANDLPYLVMQSIAGRSLQERIDRTGPLGVKKILRIGMQVASGLAAAHAQGLVHRDIKPANILLENGVERVKITDFGLARAVDDASLTQSGIVAGTPQYMAPEQARGEPVDARADLFSLGSVLYAMAAGHSPFRAETTMAVLKRVCDDQPRPICEINPDIPDWLAAIIHKLLAKNPSERYQTASEVANLLGRHLARLQGSANGVALIEHEEVGSKPRPCRRRWIAATALLVPLVTLGATEATGVTHLVSTVIEVATSQGQLVIRVDDPSIKVVVDGDEVAIQGAGVSEVRLRPGNHWLQATKDGQVVRKREWFTIKNGGVMVVSVAVAPTPLTQAISEIETGGFHGPNLVANPSFEDAADAEGRQPSYWIAETRTTAREPAARCERDTTEHHNGKASAVIEKRDYDLAAAEAGFTQTRLRLPQVGPLPGANMGNTQAALRVSYWLKTKDIEGAVYLKLLPPPTRNDGNPHHPSYVTAPVSGTTPWTYYEMILDKWDAAEGTISLVIRGKGTAWFDAIQVREVPSDPVAKTTAPAPQARAPIAPGTELLRNGGFEQIFDGQPRGWQPASLEAVGLGRGNSGLEMKADPKGGRTGAAALIRSTDGAGQTFNWSQDVIRLAPVGTVLKLSGWIKTNEADWAGLGVHVLDAKGQSIAFHSTQGTQDVRGPADWTLVTLHFIIPRDASQLIVLPMLQGRGQAWFDDLSLVVEEPRAEPSKDEGRR